MQTLWPGWQSVPHVLSLLSLCVQKAWAATLPVKLPQCIPGGPDLCCQLWLHVRSQFSLLFPDFLLICLPNCEISKRRISFLSLDQIQRHKEGEALACTIWEKELHTQKKPGILPRVLTRQGSRKHRREEGRGLGKDRGSLWEGAPSGCPGSFQVLKWNTAL